MLRALRVVPPDGYVEWTEVYRENVGWVYRLMFAKVGNRADAEDLTAEVFLAALGPLRTSATVGEIRGYLRATARTVLAKHWQDRLGRPVTTIPDDVPAQEPTPIEYYSQAERRARGLLARLPERYRRILELRFLQSKSVKEAAEELGVSTSNAKVLQHRALRMAAQLDEQ